MKGESQERIGYNEYNQYEMPDDVFARLKGTYPDLTWHSFKKGWDFAASYRSGDTLDHSEFGRRSKDYMEARIQALEARVAKLEKDNIKLSDFVLREATR